MELTLTGAKGTLRRRWELPAGQSWQNPEWHEVALALDPAAFQADAASSPVQVWATELASGQTRPVDYEAARGWHRINLDGIEPIVPPGGGRERQNDALERVKLVLSNPTDREQPARLLFAKTASGFRQRFGSAITGLSALLRDRDGQPRGEDSGSTTGPASGSVQSTRTMVEL